MSSTYDPRTQYHAPQHEIPPTQRPQFHGGGQGAGQPWYQPGTSRCTSVGCSFTGSKKSVEVHMMDRHLVYPPGWEHRKRRNDWDADPSLKGKPVPIQGTSLKLDTPEAIEQWIAERKKRFPTTQNVEDKQRKMREAIERGQLPFDDASHRKKRRRTDDGPGDRGDYSRGGRGGQRGRGRGRGRGRAMDSGWGGRKPVGSAEEGAQVAPAPATHPLPPRPQTQPKRDEEASSGEDSSSDSDSDGAPEVVSSKRPAITPQTDAANGMQVDEPISKENGSRSQAHEGAEDAPQIVKKPRTKQPRRPLYNPFAQRPSLLRNLLLPEIRMTVSNLSQAIHFLVDNDFLDDVELKPGQADERLIEVIAEQAAPAGSAEPNLPDTTGAPTLPGSDQL
ncbi:nuclear fragile X mental retardation-interacting protein 1-domain-containing protein [Trametes maxima]|nr:nuclear fragile X mental retardation-interacting protein 1-domain-containing protein [Trametes maxima]